jgi:ribose-phosphate pyrophosphokinase
VAVVSPDAGGIKRAERFRTRLAKALGRPVAAAFAEKHRSGGVVSGDQLVGDVGGKVAIILDDLISAGHTVDRAARACRDRGARRVYAAASHGLFAGNANEVLSASPVERLVVTDTVPGFRIRDPILAARVSRVATAGLFAEAIARLHGGGSIVELLER